MHSKLEFALNNFFLNLETITGEKKSSLSGSSPESFPGPTSNGQLESVFVKHVRVNGPAYLAGKISISEYHFIIQILIEFVQLGLREGDRLVSINKIQLIDKSYQDIILLVENR